VERAGSWRATIARHELSAFFVLAFIFSWYPWIIALTRGTTSGPNPLGPLIAALTVAGIAQGWSGVRELLGRMVRARFGLKWYAVIFGLPVLFCAAAIAIMAAFGKSVPLPAATAWREMPDRFLFIFLFIGLGEEPGWRGFALPRLQERHTPFVASLIIAPIWALWHLPLTGNEFPLAVIPAFLISLAGGTLIQTWLFNRTNGSVFAQRRDAKRRDPKRKHAVSRHGEHSWRRARVPAFQRAGVPAVLVRLRNALADRGNDGGSRPQRCSFGRGCSCVSTAANRGSFRTGSHAGSYLSAP
jgi:membrane protease YdiL (CAAX protease family)